MIDIDVAIGAQLERLRSERGWSVQELSERTGAGVPDVTAWEMGDRRISAADLYRVVTASGCSVKDVYRPVAAIVDGERQLAKVFGAQGRNL